MCIGNRINCANIDESYIHNIDAPYKTPNYLSMYDFTHKIQNRLNKIILFNDARQEANIDM